MIIPRALTLAVSQLNFLAITILASTLTIGSLAIFNLAYNIWTFPLGVFAGSLAMAVFPTLSESVAKKDRLGFAANFSANFRQIAFLVMPISVFFIILASPIVQVILGTGKFSEADIILTVQSLIFLSCGLLAESLILLLTRGFFAFDDAKTPFWLGLFSSLVRIGSAWFLSFSFGVAGLALGYALGGILYMLLLWVFLRKKVGNLNEGEIFAGLFKMAAASLLAVLVTLFFWQIFVSNFPSTTVQGILLQGFIAGSAGVLVYFLAGLSLKLSEATRLWRKIRRE
jgi:putative peptidoglycan lipid II flippase